MSSNNHAKDKTDGSSFTDSRITRRGLIKGAGVMAAGMAMAGVQSEPALAERTAHSRPVGRTKPDWISGIPNGRDIGGILVADGKLIRTGIMLRTAALAGATQSGLVALQKAGVADIIDLRTEAEVKAQPDPAVTGANEVYLNVFGNSAGMGVADFLDPQGTRATADAIMIQSYREMVTLDSAHDSYKKFLQIALAGKPFAFHCTEGKDRTGWGAAILLHLLGASKEQIYADYLLSNVGLVAQNAGIVRHMKVATPNVNMAVLTAYLTVSPNYLNAAYDEVRVKFGSFDGYVKNALAFDEKLTQKLRRLYLTS